MRIRNLLSFVKVARLGSFRAASAQLHVSQPAISARINALEDELGVALFRRGKSGTHLTSKGSEILPLAESMLAIHQKMKVEAGQQQQLKGTLKIGIADTLAHLWLSPLLQQWQSLHPHISFELACDVTPVLTKQLKNHQIDLSLMVLESSTNNNLVSQLLSSYPQIWVMSPTRADNNRRWSIAQMAKEPILSFPRDTVPWLYLQQLFKAEPGEALVHTCSSVASLISLTEQGLGIALLPLPLVEKQIAAGSLVKMHSDIETSSLDFCCSWREDDERNLPKLLADAAREIMQN